MNIRALIVDDEELARKRLAKLLARYAGEITVCGEAADGIEAVRAIGELHPDVLFLDVQMPGADGFSVVRQIPDPPFIVFTTAYNDYALRAFEENSVDYLLKPIEQVHLERAVAKLRRLFSASPHPSTAHLEELLARLAPPQLPRFKVPLGDRVLLIDPTDVVFLEAREKLTYLHTVDHEYPITDTLADLEARLARTEFRRVHRSFIVNTRYIGELRKWFAGRYKVCLKDKAGTQIVVSRSYAETIQNL